MFILNIDNLNISSSEFFICKKEMSDFLVKNGFCLIHADYSLGKYYFIKTKNLINFLRGGE